MPSSSAFNLPYFCCHGNSLRNSVAMLWLVQFRGHSTCVVVVAAANLWPCACMAIHFSSSLKDFLYCKSTFYTP